MDNLSSGILIVDFGSQTTLLIARRIRELGVYTEVWSCYDPRLMEPPPSLGVILSGGPASVSEVDSPRLAEALLEQGRPVLGICYGMQLIVEHFGGKVAPGTTREYGRTVIVPEPAAQGGLLDQLPAGGSVVWMSHGDAVERMPEELTVAARSEGGVVAGVQVEGRPIFGVQFHPEVTHTEQGTALLRRFALELCGASGDWTMAGVAETMIVSIREQVGEHERVICGLSGGVDSSVTAALIARAIGERLVCILVDNGLMRAGEVEQVASLFRSEFDVELRVVDASDLFIRELAGVTDPEVKRKTIGRLFIDVFEEEARSIDNACYLAQGTLYPDVIESVSVKGPSSVIKSHHNVGGLPERLPFELIEPLRMLFKDEVREMGRLLKLPESIVGRHPFPGPGLAIRILGEVTEERLAIVREADRIYIEMLHELDLYHQIWQAFAVLLPVKTVGVMGDARTYESVLALRAVTSLDGMTADRALVPIEKLALIADRITNEVRGINRVTYDLSSKPPATIEWE
ncbi:MAG: glutamine-hydrolyzing GMP synthase [Myxococcota bacterium]